MTKEEHERNQRRRMRQLLGLLLGALILIGTVAVVRAAAGAIGGLFDKTDEYTQYADKLEGFVMFDPLPFDGIENMDDTTLRSAAVWGTVYGIMDTKSGFDSYSRDPDTDMVMLPSVEVDAYLAKVLGPTFKMDHKSFDMEDMTITYDDVNQCYLIPVTSSVGSYTPMVTKMFKRNGKLYVTMGYVPVTDEFDITTSTSNQPTKYMDYVFSRTNGNWFLSGLTESETKAAAASATPAPGASSAALTESDVESAILAGVNGEEGTAASASASSEAASDAASSESASSGSEAA
jgi:hypothetical protein